MMEPGRTEQSVPQAPGAPPVPRLFSLLDDYLSQRRHGGLALGCFVALAACAALDLLTGPELASSIFYIVPVAVAAWYLGWRGGLLFVAMATFSWHVADLIATDYNHAAVRYWNTAVRGGIFLTVAYLMAALQARLVLEQRMARVDALTGLPNWRAFLEASEREFARNRRLGTPITLAYLDMDDFKYVNDTRGHAAGNELLHDLAQGLRAALRITDVVARVGGDEFVLLLPESDMAGARIALEKVRHHLAPLLERWGVGFSVGAVTRLPGSSFDREALIRAADDVMYEVKASGKNTVRQIEL